MAVYSQADLKLALIFSQGIIYLCSALGEMLPLHPRTWKFLENTWSDVFEEEFYDFRVSNGVEGGDNVTLKRSFFFKDQKFKCSYIMLK